MKEKHYNVIDLAETHNVGDFEFSLIEEDLENRSEEIDELKCSRFLISIYVGEDATFRGFKLKISNNTELIYDDDELKIYLKS